MAHLNRRNEYYFHFLFINYNTTTNYILIISNFKHLLGVVSQTRVFGGNQTHDSHANILAYYQLDYQGTFISILFILFPLNHVFFIRIFRH